MPHVRWRLPTQDRTRHAECPSSIGFRSWLGEPAHRPRNREAGGYNVARGLRKPPAATLTIISYPSGQKRASPRYNGGLRLCNEPGKPASLQVAGGVTAARRGGRHDRQGALLLDS